MNHGENGPADVANTAAGGAEQLIQARDIAGGVHVHGSVGGTAVPPFPPPRQLPREITNFTGRDAELAQLDALLGVPRSATVVISAIAGAAGIGKTSLALRWAHRVRGQFTDGQLYVNLRGYDSGPPMTASHALDSFLRALGVPHERLPEDVEAKAGIYRSLLAGRKILVLLDNAATPDQVRPLLPNEPGCQVLVTSRSRLSGLVARDGARRISLDVLAPDEAYSLLRDIIGHERADPEPDVLAELARRCDYLPLALRIAAERVASRPHHAIADLVHHLADEQHRLDVLTADDDETTAVRTVFSWTYHALPSDTARAFRLLGLQPGPTISLEATTALIGARSQHHLDALVSVHLLTEPSRGRYQFHDLLRAYAAERATTDEPAESRDSAIQRLYQWYLHTAHAALFAYYPQHPEIPIDPRTSDCHPLAFTDHDHARRWFIAEHANLMAIVRRAPEVGQYTVGWQLPNAVDRYLANEQPIADRVTVHQLGLAAAQHLGHQLGQRWAYGHLGEALHDARRYNEAITCFKRGLEIGRKFSDKFGRGASLGDLARTYNQLGRYAEAAECSRDALKIYMAIGHKRNEGLCLVVLGDALCGMRKFDQALAHIQQGMDIFTTIGAAGMRANALCSLAKIYRRQGRRDKAVHHLLQAVTLLRTGHSDIECTWALDELGTILNDMGMLDRAREAWREALDILIYVDSERAAQIRARLDMLD